MKYFLLLSLFFPLSSQALEVSANTNKKEIALNETLSLTIKIQSKKEKIKDTQFPDPSQIEDFYFLGESSQRQSSVQIINSQIETISALFKNYQLQAKKKGILNIPSLEVKVNRKTFKTSPLSITVGNENKRPVPSPRSSPWPQPFSQPHSLFDIFDDQIFNKNTENNVKLSLRLNKRSFYKKERIKADWFILQSSNSNYDFFKQPELKGFWKEEIKNKKADTFIGTEVIDNVLYQKISLTSLWLFPLKTGELTVDSYSIRVHKLFGLNSVIQSSPVKKIQVKEIPLKGKDNRFTGAIGSFTVKASLQEQTAKVNQPFSYKVVFKGSGHPRFIQLPSFPLSPHFETYPPVEKSSFSDSGMGTKEFEILIIPKNKGTLLIPSWQVSTFDPAREKYIIHTLPSFSLNIEKGDSEEEDREIFFNKEEKNQSLLSFDFLKVFYWPRFINHDILKKLWVFLYLLFSSVFIYIIVKKFSFQKRKSLSKKLDKDLTNIKNLLEKKNWRKACLQMIHVNDFIIHSSQTKDVFPGWRQALDNLPPSLNKKYAQDFKNLFKDLESLSFSSNRPETEQALHKAKELLKQTQKLSHSFLSDI